MNAVYWGLTALYIMNSKDALDREETIEYVMSCWDEQAGLSIYLMACHILTLTVLSFPLTGGFGAHPDHDAHIHSTLSAIQILVMQDALDRVDVDRVTKCIYSIVHGIFTL